MASYIARLLVAGLIAGSAPLGAAHGQDRNLDSEVSTGRVFRGQTTTDDPARFVVGQDAGEALEVTAAPVDGSDPLLKVYDAASGELLAESDDTAGSLASVVRLFSPSARRLRIEVSNAAGEDSIRFDLIVRPSDYRPNPLKDIALGQSLGGNLQAGDEQLFRFRAQRGEVWELTLAQASGSELDPMIEIYAGERPTGEVLATNDDSAGGLNARIRFLAPAAGTYVLRATGVSSTAGDYLLTAEQRQPPAATRTARIDLGRAATGTIDDNTRERFYRLTESALSSLAESPSTLVVGLRHVGEGEDILDPVLEVGFDTPLGFASVLQDDDGGGDSNSRIVLDLAGLAPTWLEALRIKAAGFTDTAGDYALTISAGENE